MLRYLSYFLREFSRFSFDIVVLLSMLFWPCLACLSHYPIKSSFFPFFHGRFLSWNIFPPYFCVFVLCLFSEGGSGSDCPILGQCFRKFFEFLDATQSLQTSSSIEICASPRLSFFWYSPFRQNNYETPFRSPVAKRKPNNDTLAGF